MVKKKSFWLTLLTVLTAAVLVFSACGLAACSSEGGEDGATVTSVALDNSTLSLTVGGSTGSLKATVTMSDSSDYAGNYTWSSDKESVATVTGNGATATVTAVAEGSATITVAVSDSKSASCTVTVSTGGTNPDTGDGSFVLQGYYDAMGTDFWGEITFNADGTGYFGTYDKGTLYDTFSDDINWSYTDADETEITAEMPIMGQSAEFPVWLSKVNGTIVAGGIYIEELSWPTTVIFYESSFAGALESKYDVGNSHAYLLLDADDDSCSVVIGGETETGTWALSDDEATATITTDSSTYTATVTVNDKGQVRQAVFADFEGVDNLTFLPMGDETLLDFTLYSFINEGGDTIVIYEAEAGGGFEAVVGGTTYTGDWDITGNTLTLVVIDVNGDEVSYTGTLSYESDGVTIAGVTFSDLFGQGAAEFVYGTEYPKSTYETYYDHEEYGTAIAVLKGEQVTYNSVTEVYESTNDGVEYWTFLYSNGEMISNVYDNCYNITTGNWTWGIEDEDGNGDLVPVINRNYNTPYYAYENQDETWSVVVANASTARSGNYYLYTFNLDDFPAGSFAGTSSDTTDDTTYYVLLNSDGTFVAHIGGTLSTSTGYWCKNDDGTMAFGKTSWTGTYSACEQTTDADTGLITVTITNARSTEFYYVIDPSIVPVGGCDMSEFDTT